MMDPPSLSTVIIMMTMILVVIRKVTRTKTNLTTFNATDASTASIAEVQYLNSVLAKHGPDTLGNRHDGSSVFV